MSGRVRVRLAALFVIASSVGVAASGGQQVRDRAAPLLPGTATVSGVVTIDAPDARPARGAIVNLNHVDGTYADTLITDDQGRFTFRLVPGGRYTLSADKPGFIPAQYGALRPGRAGTPIAVADAQSVTGIALRLMKGAVLTGTVRDADGEPAPDVQISVQRATSAGGTKRFVEVWEGPGDSRTDDRGVYRIYGLVPGEYLIRATPFRDSGAAARQVTGADIAWGRTQVSSPAAGVRASQPPLAAAPAVAYAPVFYPNALQRSAAASITLAAGEERSGLDFRLAFFPTYRVTGTVVMPGGGPPGEPPHLYLVELAANGSGWMGIREEAGAAFVFDGVPPGPYAVAAVLEGEKMWAISNITVGNQDQPIALTLQPGISLSGQIAFTGTQPAPADLSKIVVSVSAVAIAGNLMIEPMSANAKADGTFTVTGMMPGSYRVSASMPGDPSRSDWSLRSAMAGDRDIADYPLEIRAGTDPGRIAITFTDRPTELSGHLVDASGRPASDYFIIVFSPDEQTWSERARRIVQTRPASDGHYAVRGLPPGDYLMAALTDVERDEPYDAGFLNALKPSAIKITIAEGEKKTQDIAIARYSFTASRPAIESIVSSPRRRWSKRAAAGSARTARAQARNFASSAS